jgi:Ca-activated chloride channel family protein
VKLIVWPTLAVCLAATPSLAARATATEGTLQTRDGKELVAVPLEHTDVKVRIDGFIADVDVTQRFKNPYSKKIEAVYLFPLPAQSAIDGYELATGGRTIKGELKRKDDAKAIYKAARTSGFVAGLLVQERPNLFTQAVANIEPGATVDVRIHYVQALGYDDGNYELVFPMVAGPRFVPKSSKVDPAAVQPPVLPPGARSGHDIALSVAIDAGVPIAAVRSPSHQIDTTRPSPREALLAIAARDAIPNKDFVLRYDVAGARPEFAVVPHRAGGDGAFFFVAQPPRAPADADVTPKELVFVLDTSSSMQGAPLAKAKQAIARALRGMHADDTFQIVRFDDNASALGGKLIANKPKNVERAMQWLDQLQAGGGTDMTTGIRAALALPHDRARLRVVVFLTDGFIGNEDEILALVQDKIGDARLFSFGVGSAVNRYLLEEMAAIGRGTVQVVRPDEDTDAAVARLEKRIASPLLTDVAIDWHGLAVADVAPARVPDLFAGQPLVLAGRYAKPGSATVTISGKLAGRRVSFDVAVVLPEARERPAIAAIWARGRITELTRKQLRKEDRAIKEQIVALALAHHLMSAYTAFVAVDTSKKTKGGAPEQVAVPVEVPDGLRSTTGNYGGSGGGAIYGMEGGTIGYGHGGGIAVASHAAYVKSYDAVDYGDSGGGGAPTIPPHQPVAKAPAPVKPVSVASPAEPKPSPARVEKEKKTEASETADAAMRADIGRCWVGSGHGTLKVAIEFDGDGAARSVDVQGDPSVGACVRAASKKWRAKAARRVDLAVAK